MHEMYEDMVREKAEREKDGRKCVCVGGGGERER